MRNGIRLVGLVLLVSTGLFAPKQTRATTLTFNATDSGWWNSVLGHPTPSGNYAVGAWNSGGEYRDFFTFDLSSLSLTVLSATLEFNYGQEAEPIEPVETVAFFDVVTSEATLTTTGAANAAVFSDLGRGPATAVLR